MNKKDLTPEFIESLSYTDFVGFINQWNVPPGAFSTVNKWAKFGNVDKKSIILEVGCTTGFSLRELAFLTSCKGLGIDVSSTSIKAANRIKSEHFNNLNIEYKIQDGYLFEPKNKFTHIIFGAALRFFSNPQAMIDRCIKWLESPGYILSCEFYIVDKIPNNLINQAKKIFNFEITQEGYKEVMKIYSNLELIYEDRNKILKETENELKFYCNSTIDRVCSNMEIKDNEIREVLYQRLYEIKEMSNILRDYQNYNVLVHRYRKDFYGKRFVELF